MSVSIGARPARAKAMVVSSEARPARAKVMAVSTPRTDEREKATGVSRERFPMYAGYGGAWPGTESTHRATHQRPGTAGVEGAGGTGGHGRASRSTTPSRRLACGDLAGGRARRRPEHQRSRKQQAQSQIPAAAAVGGGGAWLRRPWAAAGPGRASSRRTEPHISDQAPPVWRAPEGPEGTGGLRGAAPNEVRPPSLAGGRALRRPEHQRGNSTAGDQAC